jgi:hypothetical protein
MGEVLALGSGKVNVIQGEIGGGTVTVPQKNFP